MILDVIQNSKELYAADFRIERAGVPCGQMRLEGGMTTIEGRWEIAIAGKTLAVTPGRRTLGSGESRPYGVALGGQPLGRIAQIREKCGPWKRLDVVRLTLGGTEYDLYSIMLGKEGGKCPIHSGGVQAAEIDKDSVVYDDLHSYRLYALREDGGLAAVLLCAYLYVIGPYKPGVKVKSGVARYYGTTKDKALLEKYDPCFAARCQA